MYTVIGLVCGALSMDCLWMTPVTSRIFTDEAACLQHIARDDDEPLSRFRDNQSAYVAMRCRRTTQRRME